MIVPPSPVDQQQIAARADAGEAVRRDLWGDHRHHGLWESGTEPVALAQKKLVVKVAEAAGIRPGMKVVDVGCGAGAAARVFAVDYRCDVVGYTLSAAEAQGAPRVDGVRIVHGDFLANDLPDDDVDVVVALDAAELFADRVRLFREALRVLRPGGRFVIASRLACDRPWAWERARLLEPICADDAIPALLDEGEQKRLLWQVGFDVRPMIDLTPRVTKTWREVTKRAVRRDLGLAKAAARAWVAAALRTMRYGVVVATKPVPKAA